MMKKIFMGLSLCALVAISATDSNAESGFCSNVDILYVGATDLGTVFNTRSNRNDCTAEFTAGTERRFIIDAAAGKDKELLATVLAAQAGGLKVTIIPKVSNRYTQNATMRGIYAQTSVNP